MRWCFPDLKLNLAVFHKLDVFFHVGFKTLKVMAQLLLQKGFGGALRQCGFGAVEVAVYKEAFPGLLKASHLRLP